ncbi:MAG TPA: hydrolase TatD [Clostridiales bacterium]|nr:hydrolase TatD [Clostridiales bacterium]
MYIDAHAHYDDDRFADDQAQVLSRLLQNDISLVINSGANLESSRQSIQLAKTYPFIYACCGIHPHEAESYIEDLPLIEEMLSHEKCVAIGEIGLDYHYENTRRDIQIEAFRAHMDLAVKHQLPVVIHNRESTQDCLEVVNDYRKDGVKGLFHCFSGSPEVAKIVLDADYHISIGGTVTFKNAKKVVETVKYVPLDRLLTETDSPYLSPEPNRGKRNNSSNIPYIVKKIAEIKNVPVEKVVKAVEQNTKELFKKIK